MTVLERVFWIYPQIKNIGYITFDYLGKYSFIFIKYCGTDNDKILKILNENDENDNSSDKNSTDIIEGRKNYINYL